MFRRYVRGLKKNMINHRDAGTNTFIDVIRNIRQILDNVLRVMTRENIRVIVIENFHVYTFISYMLYKIF